MTNKSEIKEIKERLIQEHKSLEILVIEYINMVYREYSKNL